jgi:thiamine-phosphate pyrophosphorylase
MSRAETAVAAGADYIAFGAVFTSPTKPAAASAPLSLITEAKTRFGDRCAIAAIGGITLDKAPEVIAAGADLLAVITDLFDAEDIAARAAAYQSLF